MSKMKGLSGNPARLEEFRKSLTRDEKLAYWKRIRLRAAMKAVERAGKRLPKGWRMTAIRGDGVQYFVDVAEASGRTGTFEGSCGTEDEDCTADFITGLFTGAPVFPYGTEFELLFGEGGKVSAKWKSGDGKKMLSADLN